MNTGQNIFPNHDSEDGETPPVRAGNIKIGDMAATQRERINFSKIKEVIDFPNLIEIQKKSYASSSSWEWTKPSALRTV